MIGLERVDGGYVGWATAPDVRRPWNSGGPMKASVILSDLAAAGAPQPAASLALGAAQSAMGFPIDV